MASITVRNLDPALKSRLRIQAARHGRSMEDEARDILRSALAKPADDAQNLAISIHNRFRAIGGIDLEIPLREPMRKPPELVP